MKAAFCALIIIATAGNARADNTAMVYELNDYLSMPCTSLQALDAAAQLVDEDFVTQVNAFLSGVQVGDNATDRRFIDFEAACAHDHSMTIFETVQYAIENDIRTHRPTIDEILAGEDH
jgi:hypothetical protein